MKNNPRFRLVNPSFVPPGSEKSAAGDHPPLPVIICNPLGKILYWDEACQHLLGWSRELVLHTRIHDSLFARMEARTVEEYLQAASRMFTERVWELRLVDRAGRAMTLQGRPPLLQQPGGPALMLLVTTEPEAAIPPDSTNDPPPGYLPASTLKGFVHDLSNLMTGILGYSALLMRKCQEPQAPQIRKYATAIEETSLRAMGLTNRLGEVVAAVQSRELKVKT